MSEQCRAVLSLVRRQSAEVGFFATTCNTQYTNRQHTAHPGLAAQSADDLEEALSEVMTSLAPGTLRLHRHGISWKACDPPWNPLLCVRVRARASVWFVCTLLVRVRACV